MSVFFAVLLVLLYANVCQAAPMVSDPAAKAKMTRPDAELNSSPSNEFPDQYPTPYSPPSTSQTVSKRMIRRSRRFPGLHLPSLDSSEEQPTSDPKPKTRPTIPTSETFSEIVTPSDSSPDQPRTTSALPSAPQPTAPRVRVTLRDLLKLPHPEDPSPNPPPAAPRVRVTLGDLLKLPHSADLSPDPPPTPDPELSPCPLPPPCLTECNLQPQAPQVDTPLPAPCPTECQLRPQTPQAETPSLPAPCPTVCSLQLQAPQTDQPKTSHPDIPPLPSLCPTVCSLQPQAPQPATPPPPKKRTGWKNGLMNLVKYCYNKILGEDSIFNDLIVITGTLPAKKPNHIDTRRCIFSCINGIEQNRLQRADSLDEENNEPAKPKLRVNLSWYKDLRTTAPPRPRPRPTLAASYITEPTTNGGRINQCNCCCVGERVIDCSNCININCAPTINCCSCTINVTIVNNVTVVGNIDGNPDQKSTKQEAEKKE